ncbi:MAG: hypothetical protein E7464_07105 [Ruminococcaceae bacterium]|nr:hypothetical protein [Oscillospiraceae bacterium]
MLSKCLKHEFRATYALILPILLGVLVFSGITGLTSTALYSADSPTVLEIIAVFAQLIFNIMVGAASIGVTIVCVLRYWRSFHSDEGYLTMTMPVSTHTHIFSKLIVAEIWLLVTVLVLYLASIIANVGLFQEVFSAVEDVEMAGIADEVVDIAEMRQVFLFLLLCLIILVVSPAAGLLQMYAAISLGHSFNKYKKLLSVVFIYVFNQVLGILYFIPMLLLLVKAFENEAIFFADFNTVMSGMNIFMVVLLVLSILQGVGFYFMTHYFLNKKLNLQ